MISASSGSATRQLARNSRTSSSDDDEDGDEHDGQEFGECHLGSLMVSVGATSTVRPPRLPTTRTWVCLGIVGVLSAARARKRSVPCRTSIMHLAEVARGDVGSDSRELADDVETHAPSHAAQCDFNRGLHRSPNLSEGGQILANRTIGPWLDRMGWPDHSGCDAQVALRTIEGGPVASQRFRRGARQPMAGGSAILLAVVLAACGSSNVVPTPNALGRGRGREPVGESGTESQPQRHRRRRPRPPLPDGNALTDPKPDACPARWRSTTAPARPAAEPSTVQFDADKYFAGYLDYRRRARPSPASRRAGCSPRSPAANGTKSDMSIYVGHRRDRRQGHGA